MRREPRRSHWPEAPPSPGLFRFGRLTISDLVHDISLSDPRATHRQGEPWTRELISLEVRRIVHCIAGCKYFAEDDSWFDIGIS